MVRCADVEGQAARPRDHRLGPEQALPGVGLQRAEAVQPQLVQQGPDHPRRIHPRLLHVGVERVLAHGRRRVEEQPVVRRPEHLLTVHLAAALEAVAPAAPGTPRGSGGTS